MGHSGVSSGGTGSKLRALKQMLKKKRWKGCPLKLCSWCWVEIVFAVFFLRFILSIQGTAKGGQLKRNLRMCGIFCEWTFPTIFRLKFQSFWDSLVLSTHSVPLTEAWDVNRRGDQWCFSKVLTHFFCSETIQTHISWRFMWYQSSATSAWRILCYAHLNTSCLGLLTELGKKKWMRKGGKFHFYIPAWSVEIRWPSDLWDAVLLYQQTIQCRSCFGCQSCKKNPATTHHSLEIFPTSQAADKWPTDWGDWGNQAICQPPPETWWSFGLPSSF